MSLSNQSPLAKKTALNALNEETAGTEQATGEETPTEGETPEEGNTEGETPTEEKKEIVVPKDDMPDDGFKQPIEDVVLPSISVDKNQAVTNFYAGIGEDVYLSVNIVNPNSYAILRFTLNGVVYQSYQFEEGSTSTLLVLKVNAGDVAGIFDYTIDAIKYVEDESNEIKDVVMDGTQTVKLSVAYDKVPAGEISNESMDLTSYGFNLFTTDVNNLCDFENGGCKLYLYDGEKVIKTQDLVKGDNRVQFTELVPGKTYEYCVVAVYDDLSKDGKTTHVIMDEKFSSALYCKVTNVSSTKTSISYDYKTLSDNGSVSTVILFDENGEAVAEGDETKTFDNLLSGVKYELRLYFTLNVAGVDYTYYDSVKVTTKAYTLPQVSALYAAQDDNVSYKVNVDDEDNLLNIKGVKLYDVNGEFVAISTDLEGSFTNLNRNATYYLTIVYEYDLHNGKGVQEGSKAITFSTSKAIPTVKISPTESSQNGLKFALIVSDPNAIGSFQAIRLYRTSDHAYINQLQDMVMREFTGLSPNTSYTLEVSYYYDLGDGSGAKTVMYTEEITTAKTQPTATLDLVASADSLEIKLVETDPDDAGTLTKLVVKDKDGEVVKEIENPGDLETVEGLLSGKFYSVEGEYVYDLNDYIHTGTKISLVGTAKTITKTKPEFTVASTGVSVNGFSYAITVDDKYETCTINKVTVSLGEIEVESFTEDFLAKTISGLYSNSNYTITIDYTYDLNDGTDPITTTATSYVRTSKRDDIVINYVDMAASDTAIEFNLKVVDKDNLSTITAIEVYDQNNEKVGEIEDLTVDRFRFDDLAENSFYLIKTTFEFDLNDGLGVQTDTAVCQYGTSGYAITVKDLTVINNENPAVGEKVQLRVSLENINNLNVTAIYISKQRAEIISNNGDYSDVIVEFVPDTTGGRFNVAITGYEYVTNDIPIQKDLATEFEEEIIIMGEMTVTDYFAVSDTYYESYSQTEMRILEVNNPTGYQIKEIQYLYTFSSSDGQDRSKSTTNFTMIDENHILIKQQGIRAPYSGADAKSYLVLTGIKYGIEGEPDTDRTMSLNYLSCEVGSYSEVVHIRTVDELLSVSELPQYAGFGNSSYKYYILDNDLDITGEKWTGLKAGGVFDGNGHTIKGLTISVQNDTSEETAYGLFSSFDGIIFDLKLTNVFISVETNTPNVHIAGIAALKARVYDSQVSGTIRVTAQSGYVSGVCDGIYGTGWNTSNYYGVSTNNSVENLKIYVTGNVQAGLVQNMTSVSKFNVTNSNYETNNVEVDTKSAAFGDSFVEKNGVVSYPLTTSDTKDTGALFVNKEFKDVTYTIHTNCTEIADFTKTGATLTDVVVKRTGYEVEWHLKADFSDEPITFPYMSDEDCDIYAKWIQHSVADTRYTYEYWDCYYGNNCRVQGYRVKDFGTAATTDKTFVVGGYYNGKPVIGVSYEAISSLFGMENGRIDDEVIAKAKEYTFYYTDTVQIMEGTWIVGTTYIDYKMNSAYSNSPFGYSGQKVYVSEANYEYYKKWFGIKEGNGYYYSWTLDKFTSENNPFNEVCTYPETDDSHMSITGYVTSAANIYDSVKYQKEGLAYSFEEDGDYKYMIYNDTRFLLMNGSIYSNVDSVEETEDFRFIKYTDGSVVLVDVLNTVKTTFDLTGLGVTEIAEYAFSKSSVKSINLGDTLVTISNYAFYNTTITSISIPNTVTSIGAYAFASCPSLNAVSFGTGLTSIGAYAFSGDWYVQTWSLPNGLKSIGSYAFQDCRGTFYIPKTVTRIEESAIRTGYSDVLVYVGSSRALKGWSSNWCSTYSDREISIVYNTGTMVDTEDYSYIVTNDDKVVLTKFKKLSASTVNLSFEEGELVEIADNAFGSDQGFYTNITTLEIPNTVTKIGKNAFYGCNYLKYVVVPSSVTSVAANAFNNDTIVLYGGSSTSGWGANAANTIIKGYKEIVEGDDFTFVVDVNNDAYIIGLTKTYTKSVVDFEIEGYNVVAIPDNLFYDNDSITTVIIPSTVKKIGSHAFYECSNLISVTLNEGLEVIDSNAFGYCWNLTSLVLPNTLTTLKNNALQYNNIRFITIPSSVTTVGVSALYLCNGGVIVHTHNERIPEGWDQNCYGGSGSIEVVYNDGQKHTILVVNASYSSSAKIVYNETITSEPTIMLNNSAEIVGWYKDKEFTTPATFPYEPENNVEYLYAKVSYSGDVWYYTGTGYSVNHLVSGKDAITVTEPQYSKSGYMISGWYFDEALTQQVTFPYVFNPSSTKTSLHLYPKFEKITYITEGNYKYYNDLNGNKILVEYTGTDTVVDLSSLENLVAIDGAFKNNSNIVSVVIPEGVTKIGSNSFNNCRNLATVTLPSTLITIGDSAFNGDSQLRNVVLPENLTSIGSYAFYGCSSLIEITIPANVSVVASRAFYDCGNLSSVTFNEGLTTISEYAFRNTNISLFELPSTLNSVGYQALRSSKPGVIIVNGNSDADNNWDENYYCLSGDTNKATVVYTVSEEKKIVLSIPASYPSGTQLIYTDTITEEPSITLANGRIVGWYTSSDYAENSLVTFPYVSESIDFLYAKVEYKTEVKANINGTTVQLGDGYGSFSVSEYVPTTDNYIITKWYSDAEKTTEVTFPYNVNGDTSKYEVIYLYPEILNKITIWTEVSGWGDTVAATGYGEATLTTAPNSRSSSYIVEGWYEDYNLTKPVTFPFSTTTSTTIYAKASYKTFVCAYESANTNASYTEVASGYGNVVVEVAPTAVLDGYYVEGWYTSSTCSPATKVTFPYTVAATTGGTKWVYLYPNFEEADIITSADEKYEYYLDANGKVVLNKWYDTTDEIIDLSNIENLVEIGKEAFKNNTALKKIILPETITNIGNSAFFGCSNLEEIELPNSLRYIGNSAFSNCRSIKSITLPEGIVTVNNYVFENCSGLESVVLPTTLKRIESGAFYWCSSLIDMELPEGLEYIGTQALYCVGVPFLEIPSSVTNISWYGVKTNGLVLVDFSETNNPYESSFAGDNNKNVIYQNKKKYIALVVNAKMNSDNTLLYTNRITVEPTIYLSDSSYAIEGWYTSSDFAASSKVDFSTNFIGTEHITYLYAKVEKLVETNYVLNYGTLTSNHINYVYTFNPNNYKGVVNELYGSYYVEGWYYDAEFTQEITDTIELRNFDPTVSEVVLYAKAERVYCFDFYAHLDGSVSSTYTVSMNFNPATYSERTDIVGWYLDAEFTQKITEETLFYSTDPENTEFHVYAKLAE